MVNNVYNSPFIRIRRGTLIEVHTADLHFGAMDPKYQYDILVEQILDKVRTIHFDAFFINGDIFDHKFMSNSDVIMFASLFIEQLVILCRSKGATLVILHGTASHDANQLKLFYHYINDNDIRIVEHTQFEYIKNSRVLCIPEEYNMGREYYEKFLYHSGLYDMAVLHGAIKGSIFGCDKTDLDSPKAPVFDINCFRNCAGPIICGHVHVAGCYQEHIYYSGSPLRWKFGEEQDKGFIICLHNLDTQEYYIDFEKVISKRYDTINMDSMKNCDPKEIIQYIQQLKASGIDYIKIKFSENSSASQVVSKYYSTYSDIFVDVKDTGFQQAVQKNKEQEEKLNKYSYVLDPNLSPYEIFVRYVNQNKGCEFITVDELMKILTE